MAASAACTPVRCKKTGVFTVSIDMCGDCYERRAETLDRETIHKSTLVRSKSGESESRAPLLALRLITLMIIVVLLTLHIKSMRVFRWEHSVSGGLLVTYTIAVLGLALCAGANHCGSQALQAYLTGMGAVFMAINAAVIWQRWRKAGDLTRVIAELLVSLGVRLKRQVIAKVILSAAAAVALLIDLISAPFLVSK